MTQKRIIIGLAIVVSVMITGIVYAATSVFTSRQVEDGTRTTNAIVVADTSASGNSAVEFSAGEDSSCATSTPNVPDGPKFGGGCWPGPETTGIAGCPALTRQTNDLRPGNGDVVENILLDGGQLLINYNGATNITIRCVKVINYPFYFPVDVERSGTTSANHILFDRVEVDCGGSQVAHAAMLLQGVTVRNSRVMGCTGGYRILDNRYLW